jgi:hypothetical protein
MAEQERAAVAAAAERLRAAGPRRRGAGKASGAPRTTRDPDRAILRPAHGTVQRAPGARSLQADSAAATFAWATATRPERALATTCTRTCAGAWMGGFGSLPAGTDAVVSDLVLP